MSEHMFGVTWGLVSRRTERALDRIARKHGCGFVQAFRDGPDRPRSWFAGPNRGEPFDSESARAIIADAEAAGLWPPKTI